MKSQTSTSISLLQFKFDRFDDFLLEGSSIAPGAKKDRNGNSWAIKLYPGGCDQTSANDGYCSIAIALVGEGGDEVKAMRTCIVRNGHGRVAIEIGNRNTGTRGFTPNRWRRMSHFVKRSAVVDNLVDGALHIDLMLQYSNEETGQLHTPSNPFAANMLALVESGDSADADVFFKVGDSIIPAHKLILKTNAPALARLYAGQPDGIPILIEGMTPEVFRHALRYIYGGNVPNQTDLLKMGWMLIDAAHRYRLVGLKVAVENTLVASCGICLSNVAQYLLFADANTCPLLKEYATSFFVARAKDIMSTRYSEKLKQSPELLQELILATAENSNKGEHSFRAVMSVAELRKELGKRNLGVDGSKEKLVARLESAKKRQKTG
mmetsp:Transcript_32085/g.67877  ORF Transcript_32085/g.67877 Transcript_32085/m.67877 type:complete len:379 (+) Transcript_32085:103-1239(+)